MIGFQDEMNSSLSYMDVLEMVRGPAVSALCKSSFQA